MFRTVLMEMNDVLSDPMPPQSMGIVDELGDGVHVCVMSLVGLHFGPESTLYTVVEEG